jgi:hypothetical protein
VPTASVNYTTAGENFNIPISTAEQTDILNTIIEGLTALENHTHGAGRGAAVTRVAATSQVTMTAANAHGGLALTASTGTNGVSASFTNTGCAGYDGLDNTTGANFGGAAYAMVLWAPASRGIELVGGATAATRVSVSSAGAVTMRNGLTISAGNLGIGTAAVGFVGIYQTATLTQSGGSAYGYLMNATWPTGTTGNAIGVQSSISTAAAAFTVANAYALYAGGPALGAGSAITTSRGVYVANQGASGVTTAHGVLIDVQSGASGANIGLVNLGATYLGSATVNAKQTLGLTINQAGADDEILSLKSSDVAHGMTTTTETNTYGYVKKAHATNGGAVLAGMSAAATVGLWLTGTVTTADTAKTTTAQGAVTLEGYLKSGTSAGNMSADGNVLVVGPGGTVRFILDADGDSHQDVGTSWTNYDNDDDIHLLNSLASAVARPGDPIKEDFGQFLSYNRAALEQSKIVTFNDDGHPFVNMSKLTMLLVGAARQLGLEVAALRDELTTVKALVAGT